MPDRLPPLTPTEARILGVLIEKEATTPDVYPLTLNSLTAGCNQKTSRDPVMSLAEVEVQAALEELRGRTLVVETFGASGRVLRYAHNFRKVYGVPAAAMALLAILMLRGPQTVNELRANCDRLYHFVDASSVEAYLEELAARPSGALVSKLARQPGTREQRWAHLLCGDVVADIRPPDLINRPAVDERLARLEAEVAELRSQLQAVLARVDRP